MAIDAGNVVWNITADLKPLNQALGDSEKMVKQSMGNILAAGQKIGVAFTAIGAGITAAFAGVVTSAMDYGGAIQDAATKTGIGAEELQKLKYGAEQSGVSFDGLQGAIIKMSKGIQEARDASSKFVEEGLKKQSAETGKLTEAQAKLATQYQQQVQKLQTMMASGKASELQITQQQDKVNKLALQYEQLGQKFDSIKKKQVDGADASGAQIEAFQKLGISIESLQGLSPDQQFMRIAEALSHVTDPALKTSLAMDLFGKSGAQLIPFLNEGAAGMTALGQKAQELGLVMSGDAISQAEAFGDQWDTLKSQFQMVAVQIGSALIPALSEMMPKIQEIVGNVINWIQQNPQLVTTMAEIAAAIGAAMLVIGPLLVMLPGIVTAFAAIGPVVAAVGAAFVALTGPVGLVIAAVAAIIAAGYAIYSNWENISKLLIELWGNFKDNVALTWELIQKVFEVGINLVMEPFRFFINTLRDGWNWVSDNAVAIAGVFTSMWNAVVGGFEWVGNQLESLWNWINGLIDSGVQGIVKAINWLSSNLGLGDVIANTGDIPGMAKGGVSPGGMTWVGEQGPEPVFLPQGARVIPHDEALAALSGRSAATSGGGVNVNITINGYNRDPRSLAQEISRVMREDQALWGMA